MAVYTCVKFYMSINLYPELTVCDDNPCKNAGICLLDGSSEDYICDCDGTDYSGPTCDIRN